MTWKHAIFDLIIVNNIPNSFKNKNKNLGASIFVLQILGLLVINLVIVGFAINVLLNFFYDFFWDNSPWLYNVHEFGLLESFAFFILIYYLKKLEIIGFDANEN